MNRKILNMAMAWLRRYTLGFGFNHTTTFSAADMVRAFAAGLKAGRSE